MTKKEIILEQLNNGYLDLDTTGYKEELEYVKNLIKAFDILKGRICLHNGYVCYDAYADIKLTDEEIKLLKEYL